MYMRYIPVDERDQNDWIVVQQELEADPMGNLPNSVSLELDGLEPCTEYLVEASLNRDFSASKSALFQTLCDQDN